MKGPLLVLMGSNGPLARWGIALPKAGSTSRFGAAVLPAVPREWVA